MYIQNIMFISLSSPFSCLVYLCLVGMCVKLWFAFPRHIEQIHKIVYSLNPFVFPFASFYPSFPLFLLTFGSTLSSYFSFIFTSLSLLRNVPADIPNLLFSLHPFISLPSNTLVLLFAFTSNSLSLFPLSLSSVLVSVEPLWLHRHTDSRMCCWGGLLFWDSPWR